MPTRRRCPATYRAARAAKRAEPGSSGLGTAGSGDVLSGAITGFITGVVRFAV